MRAPTLATGAPDTICVVIGGRGLGRATGRRRYAVVLAVLLVALVAALLVEAMAGARTDRAGQREPATAVWASQLPGVQHLKFRVGPLLIQPGQNNIAYTGNDVPKPPVDGFVVGITPNITYPNGKVPPVDVVHLHHGVWINRGAYDGSRGFPNFFAAGEEKTAFRLPAGYGYPYKASDEWFINYMIHDLTAQPHRIFITYDVDFVPGTAPEAAAITPARPIWMDVQRGSIYPVFDVLKGSGTNGTFTYPDQANDPYHGKPPKNAFPITKDTLLLGTAGHLHPGGLHDDLWVDRPGATGSAGSSAVADKPGTAHLFESTAKYFEPAGAVSWDVSMTSTRPDWKVQLHPGDVLRVTSTYDTRRASWYESMGIMIVWAADQSGGKDPFTTKVDLPGTLTHGHLPENDHHGGKASVLPNATKFTPVPVTGPIDIGKFVYGIGDMTGRQNIPEVQAGQSITYVNKDAPFGNGVWHSITACKSPCNKETGIAYPLADADIQFDSGQLGVAGPPTAGTLTWQTPADLPVGTYTYFCRIHPFMRGAFKIDPPGATTKASTTA
jgi:plastocyanin